MAFLLSKWVLWVSLMRSFLLSDEGLPSQIPGSDQSFFDRVWQTFRLSQNLVEPLLDDVQTAVRIAQALAVRLLAFFHRVSPPFCLSGVGEFALAPS